MAVVKNLMVRIGADYSELEQKMKKVSTLMKNTGDKMTSIGKSMTVGITAPIIAAGAALGTMAVNAGQTADELITLSNQTGMSTETLQGLEYASRFVDVELDTMTKGLSRTVAAMRAATEQGQSYIDVAGIMQLSMMDVNGELLSSEEMFYRSIDAISQLSSETEKEIAAQDLFGKSYQELMPLMAAGSEGLKALIAEAKELGIVMGEDDLKALGEFDDSMQKLQAQFKALGMQIIKEFQPVLKQLVPFIQETVVPAIKAFAEKVADIVQGFMNLDPFWQKVIVALITIIALIGPLLILLGSIVNIVTGIPAILKLLTTPIGLVIAAIILLYAAFVYLFTISEPFRNFMLSIASSIQDFVIAKVNEAINAINALITAINFLTGSEISLIGEWKMADLFPESSSTEDLGKWKAEHTEGWSLDTEAAEQQQSNFMSLFGQLGDLLNSDVDVSQEVVHSGEIQVTGVSDLNELIGVTDIIFEDLMNKYAAEARG